jgi:hypothetical protein
MIAVGLFTILGNVAMYFVEKNQVAKMGLPPDEVDSVMRLVLLVVGLFVLLGVIFVILGICVYRAPVPCTVAALVLYIGGWLGSVALTALGGDPKEIGRALMGGIIIKIFIIIALSKAIKAAIAYQKENERSSRSDERDERGDLDDQPA